CRRVTEQRRDVLEDDPGLWKIGDIANELLQVFRTGNRHRRVNHRRTPAQPRAIVSLRVPGSYHVRAFSSANRRCKMGRNRSIASGGTFSICDQTASSSAVWHAHGGGGFFEIARRAPCTSLIE